MKDFLLQPESEAKKLCAHGERMYVAEFSFMAAQASKDHGLETILAGLPVKTDEDVIGLLHGGEDQGPGVDCIFDSLRGGVQSSYSRWNHGIPRIRIASEAIARDGALVEIKAEEAKGQSGVLAHLQPGTEIAKK